MNDFENKITSLMQATSGEPDAASFIVNLRERQEKEMLQQKRFRSGLSAFAFIFLICLFTISRFDQIPMQEQYFTESINDNEYFDTDYSLIDQYYDSLDVETFTLFMIDESNILDTEDLIYYNELFENTIEYEASL